MRKKLTDLFMQNIVAPKSGRLEYFDTIIPGFGVRIGTSARPAFFVLYRVHGKQIRQTLGRYPVLTLANARVEAMQSLRIASGGSDPKLEAVKRSREQFKPIAEEFLARYAKVQLKPSSYLNTARYVERYLIEEWGHLPIADISRRHVHHVLDRLMDAGKETSANRLLAATSKLFNWSVERGYLDYSPAAGVRPPAKEVSRDRVLSLDELRAVWLAADQVGYPFGTWIQLMLATGGQRSSDVAKLKWNEITGTWWRLQTPTKSKTAHRVPLSALSLQILDTLPRFEGPYALSTRGGMVPISGFGKAKKLLDQKSKVTGWRIHDLRRTVATSFGEQLGLHPYIIERIQNRRSGTIKGVMAVYNRATYDMEIEDALSKWGQFLRSIIDEEKVVSLTQR